MMGAMALGDYAWAYENLLNHVLKGQVLITKDLTQLIDTSAQSLQKQQNDFLEKNALDEHLRQQLQQAEEYLQPKNSTKNIQDNAVEIKKVRQKQSSQAQYSNDKNSSFNQNRHDHNREDEKTTLMILSLFKSDLPELLEDIDTTMLSTHSHPEEHKNWVELERLLHTLKGGARMINAQAMADVAHEAESLLNSIVTGIELMDKTAQKQVQTAIDTLHDLAEAVLEGNTDLSTSIPSIEAAKAEEKLDNNLDENTELATILTEDLDDNTDLSTTVFESEVKIKKLLDEKLNLQRDSDTGNIEEKSNQQQTKQSPEQPSEKISLVDDSDNEIENTSNSYNSLLEQLIVSQKDSLHDINFSQNQTKTTKLNNHSESTTSNNNEMIRLPASVIDNMVCISTEININQTRLSEHLQHFGNDIDELLTTATRLGQQLRALELETEAQIRHSHQTEPDLKQDDDEEQFDPLELDQYSEIQQLSRFIQEGLNDLSSIEENLSSEQARIRQVVTKQSKMSQEMQQSLLATRLVTIDTLSPRLQRIARQTAESLGKKVSLEIQGEQCELDRVVLQKITAPLEHMIRNAVSHGIERPNKRKKLNKDETGQVLLEIQRDGAEIVLCLSDDGRGINTKAVYKKALAMNIISKHDNLGEEAIQRLIFHSGLSTNSEVNQISGRGVGMDIAKREIKNMGGNLQLLSGNNGTEFIIRLPLTLATNHVLLFEVAKQRYAIPMTGVVGLQRVSYQELKQSFAKKNPKQLYNKCHYKLQHLAQVLQQPIIFEGQEDEKFPVLFIHMDKQRIAYRLDKISGNRDVVIKPLGRILHASSLYTAATIESDGYVIPILNTLELVHRKPKKIQLTQAYQQQIAPIKNEKTTIMIVDDSITIRKITEALLRSQGYEVITAKDGMHALEVLNTQRPDMMLLDIEMPRMDGFELLSNLRKTRRWKNLPVIMISSRSATKHRKYAKKVGVNKFMGKPYQEAELLDAIQLLLTKPTHT